MRKIYCAMLVGASGVFCMLQACEKGKEASVFKFPAYTLGRCAECGEIFDYPDDIISVRALLDYSTIGGSYHRHCAMFFLHERIVVARRFYATALAKNEENLKDWQKRSGKNTETLEKLLAKKVKLEKMYKIFSGFIDQADSTKRMALEKMLAGLVVAQARRDG